MENNNMKGYIIAAIAIFVVVVGWLIFDLVSRSNDPTKNFTILEGVEGYADNDGLAYYIDGVIRNNTKKDFKKVIITYNVYTEDRVFLESITVTLADVKASSDTNFSLMTTENVDDIGLYALKEVESVK